MRNLADQLAIAIAQKHCQDLKIPKSRVEEFGGKPKLTKKVRKIVKILLDKQQTKA